jgi:hypothetical protein
MSAHHDSYAEGDIAVASGTFGRATIEEQAEDRGTDRNLHRSTS